MLQDNHLKVVFRRSFKEGLNEEVESVQLSVNILTNITEQLVVGSFSQGEYFEGIIDSFVADIYGIT